MACPTGVSDPLVVLCHTGSTPYRSDPRLATHSWRHFGFSTVVTPLHSGHTFWQRRGCHTCMVTPFIPLLPPHENAYGENMHKHTVKPPLLLPNGGFTRPPEVYFLLPPCPPGAARASLKRTPKHMEKQGAKKEGQREAKGRPKDAKRGSKTRPGGSLGRVLGKIKQKSQVL